MSYFKRFPFAKDYKIQGRTYTGMDITKRTAVPREVKNNQDVYVEYSIKDGESPIVLADRAYNDSDMYWVILLFNDIFDIESDWPLDSISLQRYVDRVYNDPNGIHHYESAATGSWVSPDFHPTYDTVPITNTEHEIAENDKKRVIKIPTESNARNIESEHRRLLLGR